MTYLRLAKAVAIILIAWNRCAEADYQYQFSGIVTSVSPELSSEFAVDEIVNGRVNFLPWLLDPAAGLYVIDDFSANIGGDYSILSTNGAFRVFNHAAIDVVTLELTDRAHQFDAAAVAGHTPDYFSFNLLYDASDFTSNDLVDQFVFSSPIDRSSLRFDVDDSISVRFQLTDFSAIPEPRPSLSVALCCWLYSKRRRRQSPVRSSAEGDQTPKSSG